MKKQVLTIAICLSISAASALASSTINTTTKPAEPPCAVSTTQGTAVTQEQAKKNFEARMAKSREDLYSKLGLSSEQKSKAEALDKTNREAAKPLMSKLCQEKIKLRELKTKKANPVEILKQGNKVHAAKKAVREHFKASDKKFEALLTKEQLKKYNTIHKERKAEFKKYHVHHRYHNHK